MPMLGNGVVGILSESVNKWERRAPLTPSHCARLLHSGRDKSGVARIVVQPSTKRIHHDVLYEDVGCQISEDLSECGLVLGIKQPKLEMILPDRAYAFFSHTHKAQRENMPLLDKILAERVSLYDYELIVGDNGRRLLAFGKFAGRAGMIDFLHGLGQRYLSLGYSTPFLSLGASYMYSSLAAAKAAVISVGEEISTLGLPSGICPLVFIFTGSGNVSLGAQEIFKLLPHTFVEPSRLPELFGKAKDQHGGASKRIFQVYGCVVTSEDMVEHKDPTKGFDKADYYTHPEHYNPVFHKKIAPYASVIVNCMYWEQRFPRLLSTQQIQDLVRKGCPLVGISDITCDIGGSLEFVNRTTSIDSSFFRDVSDNLAKGHSNKKTHNLLVSLSGHLFDQFLINEALDIIEAAGGSFHLVKCQVGQSTEALSFSELEVGADDSAVLDQIIDSLTSLANASENNRDQISGINRISLRIGKVQETATQKGPGTKGTSSVLIIGAGRVCRPAAELLASFGSPSHQMQKTCMETDFEWQNDIRVLVASLYLKDAEEVIEGIPNAEAVQLDVSDHKSLCKCISQVEIVISLLPASCHVMVANACIEFKKHLVTASYIDDSMSKLDEKAKGAGITILGEMGLDPGIDHMMAMKMINHAHVRKGKIKSFTSYCGGLPSPAAANNPLAYKFSWSPAGAIRAGRNPAIYLFNGKTVQVDGDSLYDSAEKFRIADLPAFALECLPNRNSLVYGDIYGIGKEASTIFRGTLRYEGFGEIMGTLGRIGFFSAETHPVLKQGSGPTFRMFLCEILKMDSQKMGEAPLGEKEITERILSLGHCKERETASKAAKTIIFLGLHEQTEIPASCESPFSVTCLLMEEKLAYSSTEEDMVLLHHEVEVEFPDGQPSENHRATLLEFGKMKNGKMISAMALTVGIPAGIAAMLLLVNKIKTRGVLRPIEPEVYVPALDMLQAYGIKLVEKSG
ncbi:alpha-aminoadipic semialdehyde synthase isoform X2 [Citrus clementina]|uniref:alpha-aminoadipic semialdehyde synthase isoform X2 n=1 Tax=Citrus clementina TaxID=85681 RepID=UPI000CECF623|nr:alpha-aminoadipic semialdehyde synthase isoform X2 [Citrus x clementina]